MNWSGPSTRWWKGKTRKQIAEEREMRQALKAEEKAISRSLADAFREAHSEEYDRKQAAEEARFQARVDRLRRRLSFAALWKLTERAITKRYGIQMEAGRNVPKLSRLKRIVDTSKADVKCETCGYHWTDHTKVIVLGWGWHEFDTPLPREDHMAQWESMNRKYENAVGRYEFARSLKGELLKIGTVTEDYTNDRPKVRARKSSRPGWAEAKRNALDALGRKCAVCSITSPLHVHHKRPRSRGGSDHVSNLIVLCPNHHWEAHHKKGKRTA